MLHGLLGQRQASVNSVHDQGIARLADGLTVEVVAPDGLIEAFSVSRTPIFSVGVQWHAEWRYWEDKLSTVLFSAVGEAAQRRHKSNR